MVPLPFAASAFCFGSVPKAGRSGYLIYKVSTLRNVRSALAVRFATAVPWSLFRPLLPVRNSKSLLLLRNSRDLLLSITCGSVCLCHMLALPAKLREVDTNDANTVKRLLAILIPDLLEVGRQLIHQHVQSPHHLFG